MCNNTVEVEAAVEVRESHLCPYAFSRIPLQYCFLILFGVFCCRIQNSTSCSITNHDVYIIIESSLLCIAPVGSAICYSIHSSLSLSGQLRSLALVVGHGKARTYHLGILARLLEPLG